MPDPEVARRKLTKFLRRSERALSGELATRRSEVFQFKLQFRMDKTTGETQLVGMETPALEGRDIKAAIVDCRVFFLESEDCWLPGVVAALQEVSDGDHARELRRLRDFVKHYVRGSELVGGNFMYAGRIESDNGLGPGELLASGQIARDYIYGVALHEDDDRIARLAGLGDEEAAYHSVAMELVHLLNCVETVRNQILISYRSGHIGIELDVPPTGSEDNMPQD